MKTKSILFASLAALAAGLFVPTLSAEPEKGPEGKGPPKPGERIQHLKTELGLTDAQARQIGPILRKQMEARKALREDESLTREEKRTKLKELQATGQAEIKAILTPEQAAKLAELQKKRPGPGAKGDGPKGEGKGERKGAPDAGDES